MKRSTQIFLCYFPVLLVTLQVATNLLFLLWPFGYRAIAEYLGLFLGTNVLVAVFMLIFVYQFKFCTVSRAAAIAECAFAANYLIVQEDNLYNILFQVIVGVIALMATLRLYVKKFPLCRISLLYTFMAYLIRYGDCVQAMDSWHIEITHRVKQHLTKTT